MISWKITTALLFFVVCCLPSPSAHAQDLTLLEFTCVPNTCKDIEFGFSGTSASRVAVAGLCSNGFEPLASVTITALNCSFPVETEAEGGSTSTLQDDGCGNLIVVGEVFANGSVFDAITQARLAFVGSSQDCTGLEAGAPTVRAC
jgi:hypothetical protein